MCLEFDDVDAFGNVTAESFDNGLETARAYDPNTGRLTSIETGTSGTPKSIQDLLYTWRTNGTLLTRKDERGTATTSDDRTETFTYDDLDRLETATTDTWSRTLTTAYDDHGNITSKISNISGDLDADSYIYNTGGKPHRLTSATIGIISNTFVYDSNGYCQVNESDDPKVEMRDTFTA